MAKVRSWDSLTPSYRHRLSHGKNVITKQQYESGISLKVARGHDPITHSRFLRTKNGIEYTFDAKWGVNSKESIDKVIKDLGKLYKLPPSFDVQLTIVGYYGEEPGERMPKGAEPVYRHSPTITDAVNFTADALSYGPEIADETNKRTNSKPLIFKGIKGFVITLPEVD